MLITIWSFDELAFEIALGQVIISLKAVIPVENQRI